jgi:hypothetical protein
MEGRESLSHTKASSPGQSLPERLTFPCLSGPFLHASRSCGDKNTRPLRIQSESLFQPTNRYAFRIQHGTV